MAGTKLTLVPAQKQQVLIERGRMSLFLVVGAGERGKGEKREE